MNMFTAQNYQILSRCAVGLFLGLQLLHSQDCSVKNGTLIIIGGGAVYQLDNSIIERLKEEMGGSDEPLVVVPTASEIVDSYENIQSTWNDLGFSDVTVLHTRDTTEANTQNFVEPLLKAKGVYFSGGRQWRLVDAYGGTRTLEEFRKVLERGGVIAGSSAGASIQGSYLVRGDVNGSEIVVTDEPEHENGFGFLPNSGIDQHIDARDRWRDLYQVLAQDTALLGVGLSEVTAVVVHKDKFEVVGRAQVAVHTWDLIKDCGSQEDCFITLDEGEWYDICKREVTEEPVSISPDNGLENGPKARYHKSSKMISLEGNYHKPEISMYTIDGSKIPLQTFPNTGLFIIKPLNAREGIYILKVESEGRVFRQKIAFY